MNEQCPVETLYVTGECCWGGVELLEPRAVWLYTSHSLSPFSTQHSWFFAAMQGFTRLYWWHNAQQREGHFMTAC